MSIPKAQRNITFGDLLDELEDNEEYEAFTEKFKPKKTTDDCLTPPAVYEAIAAWVAGEYSLDPASFVRPFYPGGDYELFDYPAGCTVVDNPPFSILAKICKFYQRHGIKFFLFGPSLTPLSTLRLIPGVCAICTDADIIYENGANVNTAFCTNLEPETACRSAPTLQKAIDAAVAANKPPALPKYEYPPEIITQSMIARLSKYGIPWKLPAAEALKIRGLAAQKPLGKEIYGGGLLISARQAAIAQAAMAQARAMQEHHAWELSAHERELVASLDPDAKDAAPKK